MRTETHAADDIDIAAIGSAVWRALPKTLLAALALGGLSAGVLTTMLPKYSAQTVLQVVSTNPESLSTEKTDAAAVATHVTALKSTDLQQKMSREFKLAQRPEFNNALPAADTFTRMLQLVGLDKPKADQSDEDRVRQAYFTSLRVGQGRETRAINVEFTTSDPKLSAAAANTLARLYRESLTTRTLVSNTQEAERLKPQVERVREELAGAEQMVTRFRAESDQFATGGASVQGGTQAAQQLGELTAEATRAATARQEAETRARTAREQMAAGTAEANPDVQKSALIPRLAEQRIRTERQVSELAATLLPAHPRMRQVQGDLASLNRQIKDEVRKVVDGLERDAKIAKDREDGIVRRIEAAKRASVSKAPQEAQLKAFEEAAKNKRAELERIEKAYNEALSKGSAPTLRVGVEIIQEAIPNLEKVFPKPTFFGPLVAFVALLTGLAWVVTRALVKGSRRAGAEMAAVPARPEATALPAQGVVSASAQTATPLSAAIAGPPAATSVRANAPAIAGVAQKMIERRGAQSGCRSLIAGESAAVDAAAEALAFAKALSAAGKQAVLVDWTVGSHGLSDLAGAVREPGLAHLIEGQTAFEDAIQRLADSDAHFIPAGELVGDKQALFDPDRASLVLDALDEAYDHIVVHGSFEAARTLFQAVQGRFDAGVTVLEARRRTQPASGFLGFDVGDMDVYQIERPALASAAAPRRVSVARGAPPSEARA